MGEMWRKQVCFVGFFACCVGIKTFGDLSYLAPILLLYKALFCYIYALAGVRRRMEEEEEKNKMHWPVFLDFE